MPVYTSWSAEDLRADGTSLKNYGFGISLVGGLSGVPNKRGSNAAVAFKRGTQWRAKQWDETKRTFTMWVDARDPSTGLYPATNTLRKMRRNENLRIIYGIFGKIEDQILFERDVIVSDGAGGSMVETWRALGEYVNDPLIVQFGDTSDEETNFNIDLLFPDPFWYGPTIASGSITAGGSAVVVNNTGEVYAEDMTITITATTNLANPILTNSTNGVSFTLGITITAGDSVVVKTAPPQVKRTSDNANLIGSISNSGSRPFMRLETGSNSLALTATSGTGTAVVSFRPPHF